MRLFVSFLSAFLVTATSSSACTCAASENALAELENADLVFVGRALTEISNRTQDVYPAHTTFRLLQNIKGPRQTLYEIHHHNAAGPCGVGFNTGDDYLVMAIKRNGRYITHLCLLSRYDKDQFLEQLAIEQDEEQQ